MQERRWFKEREVSSKNLVNVGVLNRVFTLMLDAFVLVFHTTQIMIGGAFSHSAANLVGPNVRGVLPQSGSLEGARKALDRGHNEAWSNFNKRGVNAVINGLLVEGGVHNLIMAEPDAAIDDCKRNNVIDERLCAAVRGGHGEDVRQELLCEAQGRGGVEGGVENKQRAGETQGVSGEGELGHGVQIGDVEVERGPEGRLDEPEVEIVALPRLEEQDGVAGSQLRGLVGERQALLGVQFSLLLGVGEQRQNVVH